MDLFHSKKGGKDQESIQTQDINNTNDPQKKYHLGTVSKNFELAGLIQFHGANLALNSDADQDTFWKVTKHNKPQHKRQLFPSRWPKLT